MTHSIGMTSAALTSIALPAYSACSLAERKSIAEVSAETRWWGVSRMSNQCSDTPVSTWPLWGMSSPSTTSKAEIRSLATMRRWS
jgi:hypothetical protein